MSLYILVGAYTFNSYMADAAVSAEEGTSWTIGTLMVLTILLTGGSLTLNIASYFWFLGGEEDADCGNNAILITVTLGMQVVNCALRFRDDSSIFTSAAVNFWLAYLLWSALASQPDQTCNTLKGSVSTNFF